MPVLSCAVIGLSGTPALTLLLACSASVAAALLVAGGTLARKMTSLDTCTLPLSISTLYALELGSYPMKMPAVLSESSVRLSCFGTCTYALDPNTHMPETSGFLPKKSSHGVWLL